MNRLELGIWIGFGAGLTAGVFLTLILQWSMT